VGAVAATAREAKQRAAQSKTVERAREAADRVREEAGGGIQHIQAVLPTLQGDDDDQYDEESQCAWDLHKMIRTPRDEQLEVELPKAARQEMIVSALEGVLEMQNTEAELAVEVEAHLEAQAAP
jgi:hypothetical protein